MNISRAVEIADMAMNIDESYRELWDAWQIVKQAALAASEAEDSRCADCSVKRCAAKTT